MADRARIRGNSPGLWIYIKWQGQRHHITCYQGHPDLSFRDNLKLAQKAKDSIDREIERGIFRPERWKSRAKKMFTVAGYSEHWLSKASPDLSEATAFDYRNSFKNHIIPFGGEDYIEDINHEWLLNLLNSIGRAPHGKKNVMGALKRMLRYAYVCGHIIAVPPFPEMRGRNAVIPPPVRWVEPAEQMKILEAINKLHRPIFLFISLTGCRPSEARAFRRQDIRENHITFAVTFGRKGELKEVKGKKIQPWPLTEALKRLFREIPKGLTPHVFVNPYTGRHYMRDTLNKIFRKARAKAGIDIALNEWGRKSFAMQMLRHMDKAMVSYLLRHQDPRMIEHYAEYQTDPIKGMLDKVQTICTPLAPAKTTVNDKKSDG